MNKAKDKAPFGWYVATYILRFIDLAEPGNDDPERRFHTWENTVLIKANGLAEAFDKTVKVAKTETKPYKGGKTGADVQWVFEGITEILPIYEKLEDGAEIMFAKHAPRKLSNIRKPLLTKDDLI